MIDREDILNLILKTFDCGLPDSPYYMGKLKVSDLSEQLQKCRRGSIEFLLLNKLIVRMSSNGRHY